MINTNTQSILLLTSYFSKSAGDAKPLAPTEWGRFALWLNKQGLTPADLVTADPRLVLQGWKDDKITLERVEQLLGRGHALALALEKWSRAGIWVLTRSDAEYPKLLKQRLGISAPPVLFGCGNMRLLNQSSVCVVGARKADERDLKFSMELGGQIVHAGLSVVSGGARGVDEAAMLGGLQQDGTVIGVMADSLLSAATAKKWHKGLMESNLVLVSPFYPEAGFNAGNAMARNKYIYCLSQAAVVVRSDVKGGTWSGALENLKKSWVPLWVKRVQDVQSGNQALVEKGGFWLDGDAKAVDINSLLSVKIANVALSGLQLTQPEIVQADILTPILNLEVITPIQAENQQMLLSNSALNESPKLVNEDVINPSQLDVPVDEVALPGPLLTPTPDQNDYLNSAVNKMFGDLMEMSFYQFFLCKLAALKQPVTMDELLEQFDLPKKQISDWLKKSVDDGTLQKLAKPVRYRHVGKSVKQPETQLGLDI